MNSGRGFALLYGIMLGDGCISRYITKERGERCSVCISGDYYGDWKFYEGILIPLLKSLGRKSVTIKKRPNNGTLEINFPDKRLFDLFVDNKFPVGKKGTQLEIPKIFYKDDLIREVIQGFFSTDGSVVLTKNPNKFYPRLEGHGISPKLILQIKEYLNKLGMKGHFYECKRSKMYSRWKTAQRQYRFQFNGEENFVKFNNLIGFVNPKHKRKFQEFLKYSKKYNKLTKAVSTQKQKPIREKINKRFNEWLHQELNLGPPAHETGALTN